VCLLSCDAENFDLGVILAVALGFAIVLAAAHFENVHLVAAPVGHDFRGVPSATLSPSATIRTWLITISEPTSAASCSIFSFAPDATRYCLPPVEMTAYMVRPFSLLTSWIRKTGHYTQMRFFSQSIVK
jgi:hypothetical protein